MSKLPFVLGVALLFVVVGAAVPLIPALMTGVLVAVFGGINCVRRVGRG